MLRMTSGVSAIGVAAAWLLLAAVASAQEDAPAGAPGTADVWARYRECAPRLKPAEQGEFERLPPERRAAFLDAHCALAAETAAPASVQRVAVGRFEDLDGCLQGGDTLGVLDAALWSTFAGREQDRFELVRLEPVAAGCVRQCAVDAAKAAGAAILVRGTAQRVADGYVGTVEIVSVETGAVLHTRGSGSVSAPEYLIEGTAEAASRAADHLYAAPEAQPSAAKPAVGKPLIVVAEMEDASTPLPEPGLLTELDERLYSAIKGAKQKRFRIGRFAEQESACDRECALEAAAAAGAMFVVFSAVERSGDQLRVVADVLSVANGWTIVDARSMWVDSPDRLRIAVEQVALDVVVFLVQSARPAAAGRAAPIRDAGSDATPAERAAAERAFRQANIGTTAYARAREKRNTGRALFVLGLVFESVGPGLIVAGAFAESTPLMIVGAVTAATGTIFFWTGLGLWIGNQIRMSRIERGIAVSPRLRLDGLSPVVATREGGALGLTARFVF